MGLKLHEQFSMIMSMIILPILKPFMTNVDEIEQLDKQIRFLKAYDWKMNFILARLVSYFRYLAASIY